MFCFSSLRRSGIRLCTAVFFLLLAPGAMAAAPAWLSADALAQAWRINGAGPDGRSLLGTGDTLLARLPDASAKAPALVVDGEAPAAGAACLYQVWRKLPAASAAAAQTLVRPVGMARVVTLSPALPRLALLQLVQANDAIQPDDLLLPLDSPSATGDTAARSPSPCTLHDPR